MPLDPHTWNGDFVTATLLDNDLYLANGNIFMPNGIRFHARRPIYKAYNGNTASNNSLANNAWGLAFGNGSNIGNSSVIVDTPGLSGGWFDPNLTGNIRGNHIQGGSGLSTTAGGLMLATAYCLWPANGGTSNFGNGIGDSSAPTTAPASWGTLQAANSAHQNVCMCIDLVDSTAVRYASFAFNGSGGTVAPGGTAQSDGSGWASRFLAHWVSVYTANGYEVGNLPAPMASWTNTTALTSNLLNGQNGLRGPLRFLNMPPTLRASATSTQSLTGGTAAKANLVATSQMDNYFNFNGSTNTYTIPFNGLYFVHGYAGVANVGSRFRVGIQVNGGTTYWGPWCASPGSGSQAATKTQIFSLNAGDTINLQLFANGSTTTSNFAWPRLIVTYVAAQGTPATLPLNPDTSFRWTAGTPGPVTSSWNAHIANDLTFLIQRPYLLAYQTTAQSISVGTATELNCNVVAGIVHGDNGDNYSGWSSGTQNYVAPRDGWYLAVGETFFVTPTLTSTPSALALINLGVPGADAYDRYQQQNMVTSADGSGATAVSYYYLRAGDQIGPAIQTYDSTSTTINTSTTVNSHFELVWLGE